MAQKCGVPRGSEVLKGIVSKSTKESVSLLGRIRPTCSRLGAFCSCRAVPSVRLCLQCLSKKTRSEAIWKTEIDDIRCIRLTH
jgi:hypothetical protein